MKNAKIKNGNTAITTPVVLILSLTIIVLLGIFIINTIVPFLWCEKLNKLANKYMFVIEKYGYLTEDEKANLINDMKNEGFDTGKINMEIPSSSKSYGELIEFKLSYELEQKMPKISSGAITFENKCTQIVVRKNSYCKI